MIKKIIIIICITLSGCAFNQSTLINSEGAKYNCNSQGFGIIGSIMANSNYEDCVKQANAKGYK